MHKKQAALVWLFSPGGHLTMPRLGGVPGHDGCNMVVVS